MSIFNSSHKDKTESGKVVELCCDTVKSRAVRIGSVNSITAAGLSAIVNLVVLVVIPLGIYSLWHKLRHKREFAEIVHSAGLCIGKGKYLGYAAGISAIIAGIVVAVHLFQGPSDGEGLFTREGSAMAQFAGLGLTGESIILALIYGVIQTGYAAAGQPARAPRLDQDGRSIGTRPSGVLFCCLAGAHVPGYD